MAFDPLDPTKRPGWPFGGPIGSPAIGGPGPGAAPSDLPSGPPPGPLNPLGPAAGVSLASAAGPAGLSPYAVAGPTVAGGGPGPGGGAPVAAPPPPNSSTPTSTNALPLPGSVGGVPVSATPPPPVRPQPIAPPPLPGNSPPANERAAPIVGGDPSRATPSIPPAQPFTSGAAGGPGTITESPAGQPPPRKSIGEALKDPKTMEALGANIGKLGSAFKAQPTQLEPMTPISGFDPSAASRGNAAKLFEQLLAGAPKPRQQIGLPQGMIGRR